MPDDPRERAIEAATRIVCAGIPLPRDGESSLEAWARGKCMEPHCKCWEPGKEVVRVAIEAYEREMREAGWCLTPIEPTLEMIAAANGTPVEYCPAADLAGAWNPDAAMAAILRAAIAAAPLSAPPEADEPR